MVNIITIEREYGCGGDDIAQLPASRLGWKLWDQPLTEEIARLAKCPKAVVGARDSGTTVIQLPLRELWRDEGFSTTARRKSLTHKDVKQLLASGPVHFILVDVGAPPRWIPAFSRDDLTV